MTILLLHLECIQTPRLGNFYRTRRTSAILTTATHIAATAGASADAAAPVTTRATSPARARRVLMQALRSLAAAERMRVPATVVEPLRPTPTGFPTRLRTLQPRAGTRIAPAVTQAPTSPAVAALQVGAATRAQTRPPTHTTTLAAHGDIARRAPQAATSPAVAAPLRGLVSRAMRRIAAQLARRPQRRALCSRLAIVST